MRLADFRCPRQCRASTKKESGDSDDSEEVRLQETPILVNLPAPVDLNRHDIEVQCSIGFSSRFGSPVPGTHLESIPEPISASA